MQIAIYCTPLDKYMLHLTEVQGSKSVSHQLFLYFKCLLRFDPPKGAKDPAAITVMMIVLWQFLTNMTNILLLFFRYLSVAKCDLLTDSGVKLSKSQHSDFASYQNFNG